MKNVRNPLAARAELIENASDGRPQDRRIGGWVVVWFLEAPTGRSIEIHAPWGSASHVWIKSAKGARALIRALEEGVAWMESRAERA